MNTGKQIWPKVSWEDTLLLLLSAALLTYNVLRILYVPITHDEIYNVQHLPSYADIISLRPVSANNHILHSVIRKFLVETFHCTSPFMLRLDNLLALAFFLYVLGRLMRQLFVSPFWRVCGFLFVVLNPFMFEFWGLSRGYGLSISFMASSIYCFVVYTQGRKNTYFLWSQCWAILAVYSNFTLLNYFLSLQIVALALPILFAKEKKPALKSSLLTVVVSSGLLYLLIGRLLIALREQHELYYGGDKGLIQDTLQSLAHASFMISMDNLFIDGLLIAIILAIVLAGMYWILIYWKQRDGTDLKIGLAFFLLFIIPIIGSYFQHQLLGVKYLIDRTALFLIVLFKLQLLFTVYALSQKKPILFQSLGLLLTLFVSANFIRLYNLKHTWIWWTDKHNVHVLDKIASDHPSKLASKLYIRSFWVFTPSLMYYVDTKYKDWIAPVEYIKEDIVEDTSYHYYYIMDYQKAPLLNTYDVDTSFDEGFVLMKRKW